jgi:hypothetical protein
MGADAEATRRAAKCTGAGTTPVDRTPPFVVRDLRSAAASIGNG